ncbi:ABC transporter substrate-binding protein [Nocardioides speluncae]|uniref:ABC transporter substrate-binding protein n=1 Tax=Nocardioides speluncae TaxID=2670337 RepID=UPI00137B22E0|nr:ABC transporter substrate-binding protein [Nocardioides speluncae]
MTTLALLAGLGACAETQDNEGERDRSQTQDSVYGAGLVGDTEDERDPVEGGTLTFADYSEARSLDPTQTIATGASGGTALAAVYDVLVRYDDAAGKYEPWLAKAITPNKDSTQWVLDLRPGVKFSDGTDLDARAVTASIERYIDNGGSDSALLQKNVTSMEPSDDHTVVFTLARPWSTFPRILAMGAGMIVAPAASQGTDFRPIGAGPFELQDYAPSEELVLRARSDYWRGKPHLATLRFVWLAGGRPNLENLVAGGADLTLLREPDVVLDARKEDIAGFMTPLSLGTTLWINNREGRPGLDVRVRQAIAYAMDPELYVERAFKGAGMPTKDLFGPQSRWHSDVAAPSVDADRASELVEAAKADGFDGELTFVGGASPTGRSEALVTKAMLEDVGFKVELDLLTNIADRIQRLYVERDFDIAIGSASVSEADPFHQLHDTLASDSMLNLTGYASPEMDAALTRVQGASGQPNRAAAIQDLERLWHEDVPAVNLATGATFIAWNQDVHGVKPNAEYMMLFGEAWRAPSG